MSVSNMLSECQTANTIQLWTTEWIRLGSAPPSEFISDRSLAILNGTARAFTNKRSVSEYNDAVFKFCIDGLDLKNRMAAIDIAQFVLNDENGRNDNQDNDEDDIHDDSCKKSTIWRWVHDVYENSASAVLTQDNGDRDNIMHNIEFARVFKNLCSKLLMWSAISISVFKSKDITASSAPVESYFGDLKRCINEIPCSADSFVQKHLDVTEGAILLGAACYKANEEETSTKQQDQQDHSPIECIACKRGDLPTGAHKCVHYRKFVHLFDGCS